MNTLILSLISCLILLVSLGAQAEDHGDAKAEHGAAGAHGVTKGHRDNTALFPPKQPDNALAIAPAKVKLTAPAFEAKVTGASTTLTWEPATTASSYHVQVATDPNFKWLKVDEHWVKGNTYEVTGLEQGKHYFWRVAGWKDGNKAAASKGTFSNSVFLTE